MKHFSVIFLLLLLWVPCSAQVESGKMRKPFLVSRSPDQNIKKNSSYMTDVFLGSMFCYSHFLQPGISKGCPCYPSCSQYMRLALVNYGFPLGFIIGLERLIHETSEIHCGVAGDSPAGYRILDPLENNTFWWDTDGHESSSS